MEERVRLRVALFPYVPDAAGDGYRAFERRVEAEFESQHPDVDLVLRPLQPQADFYDLHQLSTWLGPEGDGERFDLVEVDDVLLTELVATGVAAPWPALPGRQWHPAALAASTVGDATYGVPHWLCGHFIFSWTQAPSNAGTLTTLLLTLGAADPNVPNLVGDMDGSWNLPALYLDAWGDTHEPQAAASAIKARPDDDAVISGLRSVAKQCETSGKNPCLDGTFHEDPEVAALKFARQEADALLGYSERLNAVSKFRIENGLPSRQLFLNSAPLGAGNKALLFVDSLVLSRRCTGHCAEGAVAFADYLTDSKTLAWMMMSKDASGDATPRYLIPGTLEVYEHELVKADAYYARIRELTRTGVGFPNGGLVAVRKEMRTYLREQLAK